MSWSFPVSRGCLLSLAWSASLHLQSQQGRVGSLSHHITPFHLKKSRDEMRCIYHKINHSEVNKEAILRVSTMSCNHYFYAVPKRFHHPKRKPHTIQQSFCIPPSPQPLATTRLCSVTVDPPIPYSSHEWTPTICALFCLASLTQHTVFEAPTSTSKEPWKGERGRRRG